MKEIEEYFKSLNKKEKIMLYLSFPIIVFILYYNFIYQPFVEKENKLNKTKRSLVKKISNIKSNKIRYNFLKKDYYSLQSEIESLTQDYRYAKISFDSLDIIKLGDKKFLLIIEYLLSKAKKRNLDISMDINKNIKFDKHFNNTILIDIKGKGNYSHFVRYIKDIENMNSLTIFDRVYITEVAKDVKSLEKIKDKNKVPFNLDVSFSKIDAMEFMKVLSDRAKSMKISLHSNLKNMNLVYISGKGGYNEVKYFISYIKNLKNVKINRLHISISNFINVNNNFTKVNRKSFEIKFKLVGIK
jgi:predicted RNA-binding protein with EMAP domain